MELFLLIIGSIASLISIYVFFKSRFLSTKKHIKTYLSRRKEKIAATKWLKIKSQYEPMTDDVRTKYYSYIGTKDQKHYACGFCMDQSSHLSKLKVSDSIISGSGQQVHETLSCDKCKSYYNHLRPVQPDGIPN